MTSGAPNDPDLPDPTVVNATGNEAPSPTANEFTPPLSVNPKPAHRAHGLAKAFLVLLGVILILMGLGLAIPGGELLLAGGSVYYVLAGLALMVCGGLLMRGRQSGIGLYWVFFLATVLWALYESGFTFWPLIPRLATFAGVGVVVSLAIFAFPKAARSRGATAASLVGVFALLGGFAAMFVGLFTPHGAVVNTLSLTPGVVQAGFAGSNAGDWRHYGRTNAGTRYAPFEQITPENVKNLKVAWTFRTGDIATDGADDQNTPLQVGDSVYLCTAHNQVIALDAETGKERWRFNPKPEKQIWMRCRGVSYFDTASTPAPIGQNGQAPSAGPAPATPASTPAPITASAAAAPAVGGACATRIITTSISAQLYALDAKTGQPCADFGTNGKVDLRVGLGDIPPNFYKVTAAPTIAGNRIIVGGFVLDNAAKDEPSGVIRAYDAVTGALVWAWDVGNPGVTKDPPPGGVYTRSTPNVWSTPSYDPELGLVYLPTGNGTPDWFAAYRTKETEAHSSSIVALDVATGRERWTFQTVHHDMWDYDVPAQPSLVNVPDGKGGSLPALIALTKRGQIFMLDRRTGKPISTVEEKPVPQGAASGDWTSRTQPYSTGMPQIGNEPLTEARMWGMTPYDQLYCRIWFKKARYEGEFTPQSRQGIILYPSLIGGFNWGSATVDERRNLLFVNDMRIPVWTRLLTHEEWQDYQDHPEKVKRDAPFGFTVPMKGTPYGGIRTMMFTAFGVPCNEPPYGTYTAIDLSSRQVLWQRPAGTLTDSGPLGIKTGLPIPVGMPTLGGGTTTASGLVFHAGAMDYYIRALNILNGEELWKARLPVGSQGTPITYISPASGRQFVLLSAGGDRASETEGRGDYVIAYALDKS